MLMLTRNPTDHPSRPPAVYNSRNSQMLPSSRVRLGYCALLLCCLLRAAHAADWRQLATQLSSKISAATGPGVIALDIANRSSITAAEVENIPRNLTDMLANSGVRVWQPEQPAGMVKVTLSESLQSYVWVHET